MEDHGPPIAYTALEKGTPVIDRSGRIAGVMDHVLADLEEDIFEGVIIDGRDHGGGRLYADAYQIAELRERAVLLSVDRDELHEPSENPAVLKPHPDDVVESELKHRLRRAWDLISGQY
ncbi:MAG: hypothetical protein QOE06_503 [Thermoleophilaceae bacterium]|jgi:hypothetical protein|nr:hypothetical protein [Thermoleophilaceae bacterium]